MRTTVSIDEDILSSLKQEAARQNLTLTKVVNRVLRRGLDENTSSKPRTRYREKVYGLGKPRVNLDKALTLAATMEDEED